MNIIILTVDSLRVDHLGISGYHRNTSPNIDKLAKEGTFFKNTYSVLPNSDPAATSILTGLYPATHNIRRVFNNELNPSISTFQEILKMHNYKTACLKGSIPYPPGVERGFDDYTNLSWKIRCKLKRGIFKILNPDNFLSVTQQYTELGMKWIKKNAKNNFFIDFHFVDLHWPYPIPKPYDHLFDSNYNGKHDFATLCNGKILRGDLIFGNAKLPESEVNHAIAHYDGGIRFIDTQIGRMLEFLEEEELEEKTIVVLTADHGESFGEHNYYFEHTSYLYNTNLKIPLIFKNPKLIPKNKIIDSQVQNVDIMPTLLDILKIPLIDKIDGVSLLPLIQGKKEDVREYVFVESGENALEQNKREYFQGIKGKWRAIIKNGWKLIYIPHPKNDIFELYDLENDPNETNNIVDKESAIAVELKGKLFEILKPQTNEGKTELSEKSRRLLRKMGYVN